MDVLSWDLRIVTLMLFGAFGFCKLSLRLLGRMKMSVLKSKIRHAAELISHLYPDDVNPFAISMDYREEHHIRGEQFTYGEVVVDSFAEVMNYTKPKQGDVFYDLGCGAGRAMFTAALCFPGLKVRGIEILPPMFALCKQMLTRFKAMVKTDKYFGKEKYDIKIFESDFLDHDFTDGNIFLLNATCFTDKQWKKIEKRMLELPIGVRVIVITLQLNNKAFNLVEEGSYQMSWGRAALRVYEKTA